MFKFICTIILLTSWTVHAEDENDRNPLLDDPCQNGVAIALEHSLGYTNVDGYALDNIFIECKELPYDLYTAIIAVLFPSRTKGSFEQNGNLDLHLIHIDAVGEILAQAQFSEVAYTGGMQLSGPVIDTGIYMIDNKKRAIGLRHFNQSHCSACEIDVEEESFNLFYPTDNSFRWVVRQLNVYKKATDRAANERNCFHAGEEQKSIIQLTKTKSHHLFDLTIVTTSSEVPGVTEDYVTPCPKRQANKKQRTTLRFDGEQYHSVNSTPSK